MKQSFKIITPLIAIMLLVSCNKIKANRLAGTYICTYTSYGTIFGEPYDTTYQAELVVESNDGIITIQNFYGFEVPAEELTKENCYETGSSQQWKKICFPKKGVEFSYGHYYQNSHGTTSYVGTRKK